MRSEDQPKFLSRPNSFKLEDCTEKSNGFVEVKTMISCLSVGW